MRFAAIADDYTGACDLASALRGAGMSTRVILGGVDSEDVGDSDAVVVALKIRSCPPDQAARQAARAAQVLTAAPVRVLYQKYCSTFDSTPQGNIGPIAEAISPQGSCETLCSIGTPATPAAHRTVAHGHLFVSDRLLSDSPMAHHPLTPMTCSDLRIVLQQQCKGQVISLKSPRQAESEDEYRRLLERSLNSGAQHIILDALSDADLDEHARWLLDNGLHWPRVLLAGGAGLGAALARRILACEEARPCDASHEKIAWPRGGGRRIVLAGSTSQRTREQIAHAKRCGALVIPLEPDELMRDASTHRHDILTRVMAADRDRLVIVASSAQPEEVMQVQQRWGRAAVADTIEETMGHLAQEVCQQADCTRLIIAGGETSGAVVQALGARVLMNGPDAAVGVPWAVSDTPYGRIALLLKSGNFGQLGLMTDAWAVLPHDETQDDETPIRSQ